MVGQPCSAWYVSLPCDIGLCWESINTSLLWEGEEGLLFSLLALGIPLEATSTQGGDPVLISRDTECMNKGEQVCSYFYVNLLSACLSQLPWSFVLFLPYPSHSGLFSHLYFIFFSTLQHCAN